MKKYHLILLALLVSVAFSCTRTNIEGSERFYFRNDGCDLAVQVDGNVASKTFILLLHGGPGGGSAAYNSGYYADKLEEKYAVVYLDQRGNGASQGIYSQEDLTLAQNSKDVYALTKFLKQKYGSDISLFLLGHSWGGTTSAHALIFTDIQSELKGWIEVDGAHDFPFLDVEGVKMFLEIGNQQIGQGSEVDFWQGVVDRVSEIDTNNITEDDRSYLNSTGFEAENYLSAIDYDNGPSGSGAPYGIFTSPDVSLSGYLSNLVGNPILNEDSQNTPMTSMLHKISIPCQFLWGKYDFVVPPALAYSAYDLVNTNQKELVIFDHSGHSPMSSEPELFVQEIVDFIELYK